MKNIKTLALLLLCSMAILSCTKKETKTEPPAKRLPISGHYVWEFEIPGVAVQESHLVFYPDSIGYVMSGAAYNTNYVMEQVSYKETDSEKRWIGVGKGGSISKDGVYFVLFLKDITDSTVTIYKHECSDGKAEAESFAYPDAAATADHGWNVYNKL